MEKMNAFGTTLLITGKEQLLLDRAVEARVRAAKQECPEAEYNDLSAGDLDGSHLSSITGGSLFSLQTIVVIRQLGELPAELHDQVLAIAKSTHDDLSLTLVHEGGQKGSGLLNKLKKAKVQTQSVEAPKPWKMPDFVIAEGRANGVRIDEAAAKAIIDALGTNMSALAGAVAQLAADWQDGRIDKEIVQRYFSGHVEISGFAICYDVLNGRTGSALEKLRWALQNGVAAVLITSAFASELRGLGKYFGARGTRGNELARKVGVAPWKLKDLARLSRTWTPQGVSAAIQAVAKADAQVKGASADPDYTLEKMILEVNSARHK